MPKYKVKSPLKLRGERHEPGAEVDLSEKQAEPLIQQGVIEDPKAKSGESKK